MHSFIPSTIRRYRNQRRPSSALPTRWSTFSRDWAEEEVLDELIDSMEAGRISHKQGLLRAQKLLVKFPCQLEIQNFIANRLWSLEMRDESTDVREKAYRQASSLIAPGFKGQISWGEVEPFAVSLAASGICWSCAHATNLEYRFLSAPP